MLKWKRTDQGYALNETLLNSCKDQCYLNLLWDIFFYEQSKDKNGTGRHSYLNIILKGFVSVLPPLLFLQATDLHDCGNNSFNLRMQRI